MRKYTVVITLLLVGGSMFSCKKDKENINPQETVLYETDFSNNDGKWAVGSKPDGIATSYENGYYVVKGGTDRSCTGSLTQDIFSGTTGDVAMEAAVRPAYYNNSQAGVGGLAWNIQPSFVLRVSDHL